MMIQCLFVTARICHQDDDDDGETSDVIEIQQLVNEVHSTLKSLRTKIISSELREFNLVGR